VTILPICPKIYNINNVTIMYSWLAILVLRSIPAIISSRIQDERMKYFPLILLEAFARAGILFSGTKSRRFKARQKCTE